jgi:ADP-heptose:LPS heptosyltransferase
MPGRFRFDAGGNSFRENIALVSKAAAVVGNDTGLMHAAAVFGVPGVAVFGPTSASVFGYGHLGHRILTGTLPCIPCDAPSCKLLADGGPSQTAPCMDEIPADRVAAELDSLLGQSEDGGEGAA